jgi:hypothetical protein
MFPKDSGELAYADLKEARQFPWFNQLKEQMLPPKFRDFEQFLASAGIDPNSQVTELAWALVPNKSTTDSAGSSVPSTDQIVGIALGQFQPDSAEAYFTAKKLPIVKIRTFSLFAFGGGSGPNDLFFFFIDSNTAAFGQRQQLEKMIGVRYGEGEGLYSNTDFSSLVNSANGSGTVWAVLNPSYTRLAMQQLVPETSQFPAAQQCGSDWAFVPVPAPAPNQVIQPPQINAGSCQPGVIAFQPLDDPAADQNFSAVLFGDCSGNWQPAGSGALSNALSPITDRVRLGRPRVVPRTHRLRVPLDVSPGSSFRALDVQLHFDARRLRPAGVRLTQQASHALLVTNLNVSGTIRLALVSAEAISGGSVAMVEFEPTGAGHPLAASVVHAAADAQ